MRRLAVVFTLFALAAAVLSIGAPAREPAAPQRHSKLKFNVPAQLKPNAGVGKSYEYPFCKPEPASGLLCGGLRHKATNPKGGVPPYRFRIARGFAPRGLVLNPRTGLLSGKPAKGTEGARIAGGPKGLWSFTVCAEDTPGLHPGPKQTVCHETSLQVGASAGAVTIESYVVTMQAEAQKWRTSLFATSGEGDSCDAGVGGRSRAASSEMASFAKRAATIPAPATLAAAKEKLVQSLTLASEIAGIYAIFFEGKCTGNLDFGGKYELFRALMLDWADAVVAAAGAAGIAVDRASLLCCGVGG